MTYESSNLTNAEYFKLNGTLSANHIEKLLFITDGLDEKLHGIDAKISEASAQFQDESLMETIKDRLTDLKSNLRGDNRITLEKIISDFEDDILSTVRDSEYGIHELKDAENIIGTIRF